MVVSTKLDSYPVMEYFFTIQGEGFHSGTPSFFVRLGGCDVGCHWCDVKESWEEEGMERISAEEIAKLSSEGSPDTVVVTGGEPMMHNLDSLCMSLKEKGKRTHVETSGAHPLSGDWDWITLSPKKFKPALEEYYEVAHELKIVIFHKSDFDWAEGLAERTNSKAELFLQPEWSKKDEIVPLIVDYCKSYPKWRISLQAHKYIGVP